MTTTVAPGKAQNTHAAPRAAGSPYRYTQFTPDHAALVLIDYQVGTLQLCKTTASDVAVRNAVKLAKAAKILGMPVVLTSSQEDNIQGLIHPSLQHVLPKEYEARIKRAGIVNAWTDPNFKQAVVDTGRTQLVMGGITTDICLIFPSISAVEDGFEVQAVMDANGSPAELSEYTSRQRMMEGGVVLTATNSMLAELVQNWSTPAGTQIIQILTADVPMVPTD